ncbi:hypothetical protein RD149_21815 [Gordonia westfalica]|uniref:Uncharacterized protein n=1 Tax=Gordonia westfalica TaxID=158898 RepID=A0ABU2GZP5_9ACTN|nr:hypothetical protein [Gordonia westfalica]MDS1116385.1 hypothetical protein [Gordonia westfalica]
MDEVNILTDQQYALLTFIAACNRNSYDPTEEEVMLWWDNRQPAPAEYKTVEVPSVFSGPSSPLSSLSSASLFGRSESLSKMFETMLADRVWGGLGGSGYITRYLQNTRRELVKPAETTLEHLVRLTWLEEIGPDESPARPPALRLTKLGHALLRDRERESADSEDVSVVVLQVDDPLAYPQLVGQLANAGEGLLVDPYLKLADLNRIVVSTSLTRLLVTGVKSNQSEIAAMQTYLDSPSLSRHVEVRSSMELHDRLLIADDEEEPILTLGTSLNGVGRKLTVLSPVPSSEHSTLRDAYETIWENAELVGPEYDEDEALDDEDSDNEGPDTDEVEGDAAS